MLSILKANMEWFGMSLILSMERWWKLVFVLGVFYPSDRSANELTFKLSVHERKLITPTLVGISSSFKILPIKFSSQSYSSLIWFYYNPQNWCKNI